MGQHHEGALLARKYRWETKGKGAMLVVKHEPSEQGTLSQTVSKQHINVGRNGPPRGDGKCKSLTNYGKYLKYIVYYSIYSPPFKNGSLNKMT